MSEHSSKAYGQQMCLPFLAAVLVAAAGASSESGDRCAATDFGGHHCSADMTNLTSAAITTGPQVRGRLSTAPPAALVLPPSHTDPQSPTARTPPKRRVAETPHPPPPSYAPRAPC